MIVLCHDELLQLRPRHRTGRRRPCGFELAGQAVSSRRDGVPDGGRCGFSGNDQTGNPAGNEFNSRGVHAFHRVDCFSTLALQPPQVRPSTEYSTPGELSCGVWLASAEQQPQPEEEAEVRGSSVRDGACMSVPLFAEMR